MKIGVYAILDSAVEAYNQPFYARTKAEAHRMFALACTKDKQFNSNPRDYTLYHLGFYDDASGLLFPEAEPSRVISAAECIAAAKEGGTWID